MIDDGTCVQICIQKENGTETTVTSRECEVSPMSLDTDTLIGIIETSKSFEISQVLADAMRDMETLSTPLPDESGDLNIHSVIAKDKESINHHLA